MSQPGRVGSLSQAAKGWVGNGFCLPLPGGKPRVEQKMERNAGGSIRVDDEAGESAVFVAVAAMRFASIQLDEDLIAGVQVQDHAVAGVVIVLVCILGNGAGPHLWGWGWGSRRG